MQTPDCSSKSRTCCSAGWWMFGLDLVRLWGGSESCRQLVEMGKGEFGLQMCPCCRETGLWRLLGAEFTDPCQEKGTGIAVDSFVKVPAQGLLGYTYTQTRVSWSRHESELSLSWGATEMCHVNELHSTQYGTTLTILAKWACGPASVSTGWRWIIPERCWDQEFQKM